VDDSAKSIIKSKVCGSNVALARSHEMYEIHVAKRQELSTMCTFHMHIPRGLAGSCLGPWHVKTGSGG
jgi:hypothetical protein